MISPQFDLMIISVQLKQEWSSMESSLYENWDEIEMLFGHLVIGNFSNAICKWQTGKRQFVIDNW